MVTISRKRKVSPPVVFRGLKQNWVILALIVLVLLSGGWFIRWRMDYQDSKARDLLLQQAVMLAHAIDWRRAVQLMESEDNGNRALFEELEEQLTAYGEAVGCDGIYTLFLKNGEIILGPASRDSSNARAGMAGTAFSDAPRDLLAVFRSALPAVTGPYKDEAGEFVSAFAPVVNRKTDGVAMVVGVDVAAADWENQIAAQRTIPVLYTLMILLALTIGHGIIVWRNDLPAEKRRKGLLPFSEAILTAICGAIITSAVVSMVTDEEMRMRQMIFQRMARDQADAFRDSMRLMKERIRAVQLFVGQTEELDQTKFRDFVSPLLERSTVEIISLARQVPDELRQEFEGELRARGTDTPFIYEVDENGQVRPAGEREAYLPIRYTEPEARGGSALGFDISSDPTRRAAIERATETGFPSAPAPIAIIERQQDGKSLLTYAPAIRPDGDFTGDYVIGVIRPQRILAGIVARHTFQHQSTGIEVLQLRTGRSPVSIAALPATFAEGGVPQLDFVASSLGPLEAVFPLFSFGNAYVIVSRPTPAFTSFSPPQYIWLSAWFGGLLTVVTSLFVGFLSNRKTALESEVAARTRDLNHERGVLFRILEECTLGYWNWDIANDRISSSPGLMRLLGRAPADGPVNRAQGLDVIAREDRKHFEESLEIYLAGQDPRPFRCEARCQHRDGRLLWIVTTGLTVEWDENNQPTRMVGCYIDVSESRHAQGVLRSVMDSNATGIMAFRTVRDEKGTIQDFEFLMANRSACRITGKTEKELLGHTLLEVFPGNQESGLFERYCHVVEAGEEVVFEQHYTHDGLDHWFSITATKYEDGFIVSFEDISEHKRASSQAASREAELRALSDSIPDLVTRLDREKRHLFANESYIRFIGMSSSTIIGKALSEVSLPEGILLGWSVCLDKCIETGETQAIRFSCRSLLHGVRDYEARVIPEMDADRHVESILMIVRDVSGARDGQSELI